MPSKARAGAGSGDKRSPEVSVQASGGGGADEAAVTDPESGPYVIGEDDGIHGADGLSVLAAARPSGLYRFTWPYPCAYTLPDRSSRQVEPGAEVWWPAGAPDALWEFVSAGQPASDLGTNTTRE